MTSNESPPSESASPSESDQQRRRAVIIAGHRGDQAVAEAHLADSDADVRAAALNAMHRIGALSPALVTAGAADPAARVRRRSATLLGTDIELDADSVLVTLLGDEDSGVVEVACWATGERPLYEATHALLLDISRDHEDALCRESAIAALGAIGDERGLSAILRGCTDKPAVRRRSVLALAPFDGPEVEAALTRALEDRDWQVRQAAEDLL